MLLPPISPSYHVSRDSLHVVATHVLARARHAAIGRFGLRAAVGGFATPAFGPDVITLRVSGGLLMSDVTGATSQSRSISIDGATLAALADFAAVDLSAEFSAGHDTPAMGDPARPLEVERAASDVVAAWSGFAPPLIDSVVAGLGSTAAPTVLQLWPEHFDFGLDVAVGGGADGTSIRLNLGASFGDGFHAEPYLYVGPWTADRPGDSAYWNAPFGAVLGYRALLHSNDPVSAGRAFFAEGLSRFA